MLARDLFQYALGLTWAMAYSYMYVSLGLTWKMAYLYMYVSLDLMWAMAYSYMYVHLSSHWLVDTYVVLSSVPDTGTCEVRILGY